MSESTEEYLEALYALTQGDQPASTSAIAKRLKVSAASVTEMLRKLADAGLVNYSRYKGVTLTSQGYAAAAKMTRKHRLLERFLHDVLKIGNDRVHQEACRLEHALSDETERAMCQTLKSPDTCPDDKQTIPACDLRFSSCAECQGWGNFPEKIGPRKTSVISVATLKEKQKATIAFIRGDQKALRRLLDLGLTPGTRITVTRVAPLSGPVEIAVRGSRLALGDEIACKVFVEKSPAEESGT
jgi:DtxR family Mn-dependent transcriptional regulator